MITRARAVAMLALLLFCSQGMEARGRTEFAVKGLGGTSCADYSAARKVRSERYSAYKHWIQGYVSAFNQLRADTVDIAPWQSAEMLAMFIEAECRRRPNGLVLSATNTILEYLYSSRLQSTPEIVRVGDGEQAMPIYDIVLRRLQRALKDEGIYEGESDGVYGPLLRDAIERFQKREGLPITGLPDQMTLYHAFR